MLLCELTAGGERVGVKLALNIQVTAGGGENCVNIRDLNTETGLENYSAVCEVSNSWHFKPAQAAQCSSISLDVDV